MTTKQQTTSTAADSVPCSWCAGTGWFIKGAGTVHERVYACRGCERTTPRPALSQAARDAMTTRTDPFHLIDAEAPRHSAQWEEFSATPGSEELEAYGF